MSAPRAEDVKEAIRFVEIGAGLHPGGHLETIVAAARAWLLQQEQTPDITDEMVERAAKAEDDWIQSKHLDNATPWNELTDGQRQEALDCARAGLRAALVGFHPQAVSPEVPT